MKANLNKHNRSLIAQLCLGVLGLEIERGRFTRVPLCECICHLCKDGVEDEIHFVLKCSALTKKRAEHFQRVQELSMISSDIEKLKYLCNVPHRFGNMLGQLWNEQTKLLKT